MRYFSSACLVACAALVAACGGGGGGGGSAAPVVPLPPTPPPAAFDVANLSSDQTFDAIGNNNQATYDLAQGVVARTESQNTPLRVAYNANSKSYTVTLGTESTTFGASDIQSSANGEVNYEKGSASTERQLLTLVTTPYNGTTSNRYVGMGYWQRYTVANQMQDDRFSTFVYGQRTPTSGMPKTGSGQYEIDVFGLSTHPGSEPSIFDGAGLFSVDFLGGEFYARAYMWESELLSGSQTVGGNISLTASGRVSSGANFIGTAVVGTSDHTTTGEVNGSFFGPEGQEVGASFATSNDNGARAVGSFTGKLNGKSAVNFNLDNILVAHTFYGGGSIMYLRPDSSDGFGTRTADIGTIINDYADGTFTVSPGISGLPSLKFSDANKVQSANSNFTAYLGAHQGNDVRLQLYKIGNANSELKLSYVSLGRWEMSHFIGVNEDVVQHFYYGFATPEGVMNRRTGSARYDGVVYGIGSHKTSGDVYDVTGSSQFNINFNDRSYNGQLALNGSNNGNTVSFGSYNFDGQLNSYGGNAPFLDQVGKRGEIVWQFYGPTGEEIGGAFHIHIQDDVFAGGALVNGVTAARRR